MKVIEPHDGAVGVDKIDADVRPPGEHPRLGNAVALDHQTPRAPGLEREGGEGAHRARTPVIDAVVLDGRPRRQAVEINPVCVPARRKGRMNGVGGQPHRGPRGLGRRENPVLPAGAENVGGNHDQARVPRTEVEPRPRRAPGHGVGGHRKSGVSRLEGHALPGGPQGGKDVGVERRLRGAGNGRRGGAFDVVSKNHGSRATADPEGDARRSRGRRRAPTQRVVIGELQHRSPAGGAAEHVPGQGVRRGLG